MNKDRKIIEAAAPAGWRFERRDCDDEGWIIRVIMPGVQGRRINSLPHQNDDTVLTRKQAWSRAAAELRELYPAWNWPDELADAKARRDAAGESLAKELDEVAPVEPPWVIPECVKEELLAAPLPADPAPVSPDYEALVRAWYAEHGMGDPVVRCPAGVKFWIGHAMSNGLWGYMALNAADTPELAWQAAWEYLSSPPESHTAPSIPAQHDHIGDAPTMVDAPNLVQSGPSSQTEQAARERMEELERAALVLAKTVQRALDEYLAPQGVHSTAFTAALAQPAIVALLEERGAE